MGLFFAMVAAVETHLGRIRTLRRGLQLTNLPEADISVQKRCDSSMFRGRSARGD
jgi:hypothetical protein